MSKLKLISVPVQKKEVGSLSFNKKKQVIHMEHTGLEQNS